MATDSGEGTSSSGTGTESVAQITRSCRGCLFYSSIMHEHGRNPVCLGLSRIHGEPQVYAAVHNELEQEGARNLRKFADFKYACIGYSAHKELSPNQTPSLQAGDGPGELPYCVGLEFLADRKPTRQGAPAPHLPPAMSSSPPQERPQRSEDGPSLLPRPPSSAGGLGGGGGGLSGDEFVARFFHTSRLVAAGVANNVRLVANSVRTTIDEIFTSDPGRPKP